jgi:uncharacterized protein YlxW (UPF0749 family)
MDVNNGMNPFVTRISGNAWLVPISAMMAVLGFLIALAWVTNENRSARIASFDPDQQSRIRVGALDLQEEYQMLAGEVKQLREENTRYQTAMAQQGGQSKLLNESLQEMKKLAGLTEVEGPGVTVILRDATQQAAQVIDNLNIHDVDVLRVVNELWNAGAEAIAVNGNRVVAGTSFRCVGAVILVNNIQIAPPVVVEAIGDPQTLSGALNLRGGVIEEIRQTGGEQMVTIRSVTKMRLPAYSGATTRRFAKDPKEPK